MVLYCQDENGTSCISMDHFSDFLETEQNYNNIAEVDEVEWIDESGEANEANEVNPYDQVDKVDAEQWVSNKIVLTNPEPLGEIS